MKICLDYADGRYSTRPLTDAEAAECEARGFDVATVADDVWEEYLQHCGRDGIWQALWRSISNEQYVRRRERELMPLEEADREIARLKEDLARSERMQRYYEDEWLRATGRQTRAEHDPSCDQFTCIFPQPGCDVDVLEHDAWRAAAVDILRKYNTALGEEGVRHQGCCCGHTHILIGPEKAAVLRAAGFLVENDSEPADWP